MIDQKLLTLLQSRDPAFLKTLFEEVNPFLIRVSLANRIDKEDVGELIHQTWETFFANLDQFEGRSQLRTFICGILFNKIREHRRLQKRMVPEDDMQKVMDSSFTPDGWWKVEPADPYKVMERQQVAQFIEDCMDGLTEQQATAFVMTEVEDEESGDICKVLGVTSSHLRVLIFRAKEKLRKCLNGKLGSEKAFR